MDFIIITTTTTTIIIIMKLLADLTRGVQNTAFCHKNTIQSEQYSTTNFSIQYVGRDPSHNPLIPHMPQCLCVTSLCYCTQFCLCLTACTFHHTSVAINENNTYLYLFKYPVEVVPDGECVKIVMYRNSVNYIHTSLALMLKSIHAPLDAPLWCCILILHQTNLQNDAVEVIKHFNSFTFHSKWPQQRL